MGRQGHHPVHPHRQQDAPFFNAGRSRRTGRRHTTMSAPPETRDGAPCTGAPPKPETRHTDSSGNPDGLQGHSTLGMELFRSRNLADIRNQLERKSITCALIGGSSPMHLPISIQLLDLQLRNAYHLVRITNDKPRLLTLPGETGDIIRHCWMDGQPAILTESPTPIWGADDLDLLGHVAAIEELETRAMKGGILL